MPLTFRVDVYHHIGDTSALGAVAQALDRIEQTLARVESQVNVLTGKVESMSVEMERLAQEVAEIGTVVDSAIVLINGLAAQIRELQNDPVALAALADTLDAKAAELAGAVSANTQPDPPAE